MPNFTHHHEIITTPMALNVQEVPVGPPQHFEGPKHRSAVLVGASVSKLYHDSEIRYLESERLARTDENTQLANRRGFVEQFNKLINDAENSKDAHVALLNFDLDNFKAVNDTVGHDVGDDVLKTFADIIRNSITVRKKQGEVVAARNGGDEFLVGILTSNTYNGLRKEDMTDEEVIEGYIERITNKVNELGVQIGVPKLGVSVGYARFRDAGHEGETSEEFKKRADVDMFLNKAARKARH